MNELPIEQIVAILNEYNYRGGHWSDEHVQQGFAHPEDARAIASYLELTRPGSWYWALEQMKAGNKISRGTDIIGIDVGFVMEFQKDGDIFGHAQLTVEDFDATDWEITDDGTEGAR